MARLALVRGVLPDDPLTAAQLARLDELAGLLDSAPVTEVLAAVTPAEGLIQAARQIAATVAAGASHRQPGGGSAGAGRGRRHRRRGGFRRWLGSGASGFAGVR